MSAWLKISKRHQLRAAALTAAFVVGTAGIALAQTRTPDGSTSPGGLVSESELITEGTAMMVDSTGKVHHIKVKPGHHKMLMATAKPMAAGTVIYRSGGKYYMATDPKLSDPKFYESNLPE
jgi:hypothetical protein